MSIILRVVRWDGQRQKQEEPDWHLEPNWLLRTDSTDCHCLLQTQIVKQPLHMCKHADAHRYKPGLMPKNIKQYWRGHSLRSIPFVMSGHLIFNFFQTLGLPFFSTNPNNGCPKRIYQHSGQAHKHFSHRFHGVSFLADVQTWRSKQKFVFIATNPPQYQNFCTQCTKIITSVSNDIAR